MMNFDRILDQRARQEDVYSLIRPNLSAFLEGQNQTIFAYGQTRAGKTYTVVGDIEGQSYGARSTLMGGFQENGGVLPRILDDMIQSLESRRDVARAKIWVSFFEVYNEKIYDLLNPRNIDVPLELRELGGNEIQINGLTEIKLTNYRKCFDLLLFGFQNRAVGSTFANKRSSRSHTIFQITLAQSELNSSLYNAKPLISRIRVVDLAGSEKFKIPSDLPRVEKEQRINELASINGSLSSLGLCISSLMEKTRTHIPFRNSKLTRVLADSLSWNSRIAFIVCISPSVSSGAETYSTLQFASRAKKTVLDGRYNVQKAQAMQKYEGSYLQRHSRQSSLTNRGSVSTHNNSVLNPKEKQVDQEMMQLRRENEELRKKLNIFQGGKSSYQTQENQHQPPEDEFVYELSPPGNRSVPYDLKSEVQSISESAKALSTGILRSVSRRTRSIGKHVSFAQEAIPDKMKQKMEFDDNSGLERLEVFAEYNKDLEREREVKEKGKIRLAGKITGNEDVSPDSLARRMNKFWRLGNQPMPGMNDEGKRKNDIISVLLNNKTSHSNSRSRSNSLMKKIHLKEVEAKLTNFFRTDVTALLEGQPGRIIKKENPPSRPEGYILQKKNNFIVGQQNTESEDQMEGLRMNPRKVSGTPTQQQTMTKSVTTSTLASMKIEVDQQSSLKNNLKMQSPPMFSGENNLSDRSEAHQKRLTFTPIEIKRPVHKDGSISLSKRIADAQRVNRKLDSEQGLHQEKTIENGNRSMMAPQHSNDFGYDYTLGLQEEEVVQKQSKNYGVNRNNSVSSIGNLQPFLLESETTLVNNNGG